MKKYFLLCFIFISLKGITQSFEIPKEDFPFYDILEWKGYGGMLLNRDPSGNMKKVHITFVGNQQTSLWNQSFNPNDQSVYYIANENARYVYFLDNLELEGGKYFYTQLSNGGNIKSGATLLSSLFKKLGNFELSDIQLVDIVTTDKALVHVFRHHNSKDKKYTEIAIFMTHHNFMTYAAIIGETYEESLKNEELGHWKFIGSTGDQIFFATRESQTKSKGWTVKEFNSKSELKQSTFITTSDLSFEKIESKSFGTTGRHYLNPKGEIESNILSQFNGKFYLNGIVTQNGKRELKFLKLNENKWEIISSTPIETPSKAKSIAKLGVIPINEGLGIKLEQTGLSSVVFMPFDKTKEILTTPYTDKITFNPSRMIVKERKQDFVLNLPDRNVFFDLKQLNNSGGVKFEFVGR